MFIFIIGQQSTVNFGNFCLLTKSKKLLAGLLLGLIISLPYFYQSFSAPIEQQIRFGRLEGRFLEPLTTIRYVFLIILIYFSSLSALVKKFWWSVFLSLSA